MRPITGFNVSIQSTDEGEKDLSATLPNLAQNSSWADGVRSNSGAALVASCASPASSRRSVVWPMLKYRRPGRRLEGSAESRRPLMGRDPFLLPCITRAHRAFPKQRVPIAQAARARGQRPRSRIGRDLVVDGRTSRCGGMALESRGICHGFRRGRTGKMGGPPSRPGDRKISCRRTAGEPSGRKRLLAVSGGGGRRGRHQHGSGN